MSEDLTEETYEEYCERTRNRFSDEMLERAADKAVLDVADETTEG